MRQGTKPTYQQRKVINKYGLDTYDHLVLKETPKGMVLNKRSDNSVVGIVYADRAVIPNFDIKSDRI